MKSVIERMRMAAGQAAMEESGQAIAEYSVVLVLFAATTLMLLSLLRVFSVYGWRVLNLVGSDFP